MQPIRIFNKELELLGEIDNYESLIFNRRFSRIGEFELYINMNKNNVDKLQVDNIILIGNKKNKAGIIMHKENTYDENGEITDTLLIKGITLNGIVGKRIIVPEPGEVYSIATGSTENIIKTFVDKNCVNPIDIKRKFPKLIISENKNRGIHDKWRSSYENLSDKITEIAEYAQMGHIVYLDYHTRQLVFDVLEGRNLTVEQEKLPPVIFSTKFDNINSRHYIESSLNYKNVAYCGGRGSEEDRLVQQVGQAEGFDRAETYIECSEVETVEDLKTEGLQKLNDFKKVHSFEVQVNPYGSFRYEEDYDLGDIVTIQDTKIGVTMNARMVDIREIYEDIFTIEITFGTNIPTFLDNIRKEIKRVVK